MQYQVAGQSYQVTSSSSSSSHPAIGSQRQIAYNPAQPSDAKVVDGNAKYFLYIFPVVGIACIVIAPVAFIRSRRRNQNITSLVETGQKLSGVLVDVQTYGGTNQQNGYVVVVSAVGPDGTVQNYVSDKLTGLGEIAMADFRSTPTPIDVYVNPTNPQDYYVDVSDIPNLTPQRIMDLVHTAAAEKVNFNQSGQTTSFTAPVSAVRPVTPVAATPPNNDYPTPPQST